MSLDPTRVVTFEQPQTDHQVSTSTTNAITIINNTAVPSTKTTHVVYIPSNKLPYQNNTIRPNQLQILPPSSTGNSTANNNVILASVKNVKPLVLTKPSSNITGTLITMIKPVSKLSTGGAVPVVSNSSDGGAQAQPKYVLTSVPKIIKQAPHSHRTAITMTTSSGNQTKMTFIPISSTTSKPKDCNNVFNVKISDGQLLQPQPTILNNSETGNVFNVNCQSTGFINKDSVSSQGDDIVVGADNNKEYELSITDDATPPQTIEVGRKYAKHGISILKKSYPLSCSSIASVAVPSNHVTSVPPSFPDCPTVQSSGGNKNRRKSSFSYRRDYDDMEVVTTTVNKPTIDDQSEATPTKLGDDDLTKILKWEGGVGTLPGSNLKFMMNEFNMLEFLTSDDCSKINKAAVKATSFGNKVAAVKKSLFEHELQCLECGCYGLPSEFINSNFCSPDCQESGKDKVKTTKPNKSLNNNNNGKSIKSTTSNNNSDDDIGITTNHSSDNSQSQEITTNNNNGKQTYPWACTKKGFSWPKYLDHVKAKAAPVKLFKDAFPYNRNCFRPGMKMEGVDPQHQSTFCVLSVAEVCGYRLRLHFDGYPANYDFWVNADSLDIFPAGFCEKQGHDLQPPRGYSAETFTWVSYLRTTKSVSAPKHLFASRATAICPNGFRIGMKLEAVDRKDTSLVCVATVKNMMDNRILVHFDSWNDIYDYWVDPTSPYIHPVGWCDQYGHRLTPPNDLPNPENFSWQKYLKDTKSAAAPVRAFKLRSACGFKRGMRLEVVDKRVPHLIRVATVAQVLDHRIRVNFDGWPDKYSYWMDDDSPEIHPPGWCQKTGHPLETPLTPDDVYDFLECATVGCRGLGHIHGPKFATHSEQKHCPYAEDNIECERVLPDRLSTPDLCVEAVVPVSREPSKVYKSKMGRPPKYQKSTLEPDTGEPPVKKRKYKKRPTVTTPPPPQEELDDIKEEAPEPELATPSLVDNSPTAIDIDTFKKEAVKLIENAKIEPACRETWTKHSRFLKSYCSFSYNSVARWSERDVVKFVTSLPGCDDFGFDFSAHKIDGEALLSVSQNDLIEILKLKIGPAIKIYNSILLLRQQQLKAEA